MLRQTKDLQELPFVATDHAIGDANNLHFAGTAGGRHMTLGRNLAWVVLGIVLSTNAHADGATIAQKGAGSAAACQSCHGVAGEGVAAAGFPRLAGLGASYLQRQLEAFADGTRASPVMMPIAKALSATDRKAVASHYASMPFGTGAAVPSSTSAPAVGATLATRGRWSDTLPACEQCHGPGGRGVGADFPPLDGQSAAYVAAQLTAFKSKARPGGPMNLMGVVAQKLSDAEVRAVADYWVMQASTQRQPAALRQASPDVPASVSKDIAGDPPHAELVAPGVPASGARAVFRPPSDSQLPIGEFGDVIRRGREIFIDTGRAAPAYVGNSLRCVNCHLDAGRLAGSSPLWAAFVSYPAYRSKTKSVSTFQQRLQGCFEYSMNGKAPPSGAPELVALESYAFWLATGATVDPKLPGRGYPALPAPAQVRDYMRGEQVYAAQCAFCHGADGAGQRSADSVAVFPPLWGPESFNWGAGMGRINNAAAFIKANMPLGMGGTLTDQQAWDVALYMNSHDRPQDPRYSDSVQATRAAFHDTDESMYGREVAGKVLGATGAPRPFKPSKAPSR